MASKFEMIKLTKLGRCYNSSKYLEVTQSIQKYLKVPRSIAKDLEVHKSTKKYINVP